MPFKKIYPGRLMPNYFNIPSAEHGCFCNATILDQTIQAKKCLTLGLF